MESANSSIWRRLGFKIVQAMVTCHTFFISFRTLEYATGGRDKDGHLDWDLIPMMFCFTTGYVTLEFVAYLVLDSGRSLNTKVYNEILKLRGEIYKI